MTNETPRSDRKGIFYISGLAALAAALCCVTPVVLVLLGLSSIAFATTLGNSLYGEYRWEFRIVALALLAAALWIYFRRRGVCTLDDARRHRNRIINTSLVVLVFATGLYIFVNYVVVHYWGIAVGLPWRQWDESWAIPASLGTLAVAGLLYYFLFRRQAPSKADASRLATRSESAPPAERPH